MSATQKNVILFTIDTLRKDVVGCYDEGKSYTPFLDSIQNNCIRFNNCQSVGPYTQASFPGILTSTYYFEFGREKQLSPKRTIISEVVKNGGFTTAGFHSNPYLSGFFGWNRGWNTFYDSMMDQVSDMVPYILGDVINAKVNNWLESHTTDPDYNPFFLWAHYMDVHEPYIPKQEYLAQVDPDLKISPEEMFQLFREVILPRDKSNPTKVEILKKLYLAHVLEVDEYARQFFGNLEKAGVLENSIVIITSDHGDEFSEHGSLSHDGKMYNELINVPLMIYIADLKANVVSNAIVSGVDVPPTIANLFGLDVPESYCGQSLLPLDEVSSRSCFGESMGKLKHKVQPTDRPVYFYQEDNLRISYRVEDNKWELYDLVSDSAEQQNIIDSSPQVETLKLKLQSQMHEVTFG
ncbi:MAG: sulfatase [Candidatus Marinimicrobia bacterium]|nr:sulfatase [Candidatus Neomarinimicrobiota bacterium]